MKKTIVALMIACVLLLSACSTVMANNLDRVSFDNLSSDSKYAGKYFATFCNRSTCWDDWGEYTSLEMIFSTPHVHIGFLQGPMGDLNLYARPDYSWVWRDGTMFERPGYFLEKNK